MKMLYQGVQSYSTDSTEIAEELPQTEPQSTAEPSPRDTMKETAIAEEDEHFEENGTDSAEDIKYYEFLKEIHKMKEITRELEHAGESSNLYIITSTKCKRISYNLSIV